MIKKAYLIFLPILALLLCLTACTTAVKPDATDPNVALMEFPGLKWNSSIKEVKNALGLKNEQILDDELAEYEQDSDYEIWNLLVSDVPFLDFEAEIAHFMFVRYPGQDFGLMRITLSFSEETDASALKKNMVSVYGDGSEEPSQSYSFTEEGEFVEAELNAYSPVTYNEKGFPCYWYSTTKGTELLSRAEQEQYASYVINANPEVNTEVLHQSVLNYLERIPLVSVRCLAGTNLSKERIVEISFAANQMVHALQLVAE